MSFRNSRSKLYIYILKERLINRYIIFYTAAHIMTELPEHKMSNLSSLSTRLTAINDVVRIVLSHHYNYASSKPHYQLCNINKFENPSENYKV